MFSRSVERHIFIEIIGLFVLLNAFFLYQELYFFLAIPFALVIVLLAIYRLDLLLIFIVLLVPFSVNFDDVGMGFGITLPTEPLLFGAMLVLIFKGIIDHQIFSIGLKHPVTIAIVIFLTWIFISALMSSLPGVSIKFLVAKLWFIIPFYFGGVLLFSKRKNIHRYYWAYIIPMAGVIGYTVYRHYVRGFEDQPAHWVMQPFFKDHTSYGAIVAMYVPILTSFVFYFKDNLNKLLISAFFLLVFLVGLIFSYTRAAWVSVVVALLVYIVIKLKLRIWVLGLMGLSVAVALYVFWVPLMHKLEKNRQDAKGDLTEHVQSISNVATDASNLERLNRWSAALKMFNESPVFGKGPGTYSFLYAPYQSSTNLTVISTNFGDSGNAHSEYLSLLTEQGVPGLLIWLGLIVLIYYRSLAKYYKIENREVKMLLLGTILGLTTYLIHGFLNNFLDYDKAAIPFWGFIAVLVALDLFYEEEKKESPKTSTSPSPQEVAG